MTWTEKCRRRHWIDEDDEVALLGEIDEMIRPYGEKTLAETLVRFE